MKTNKLYQLILLIFLIILIWICCFNESIEGFTNWYANWYKDEYILMPVVITVCCVAPAIYLIYLIVLRSLNNVFSNI